jgi:integral membrane protein
MLYLLKTQIGRLRLLAFVEGVSFLVILFITMPLKYYFDTPQPNKVFGMVHGLLFVLYVFWVIQVKIEQDWTFKKMGLALLASIIPFGTFWADLRLFRNQNQDAR